MTPDIELRLAAAAQALREHELTEQRCADLRERHDQLAAELKAQRSWLADERQDVERLEGITLTRALTSLRGARDDKLALERTEAEAAQLRVDSTQAQLDALQRSLAGAQAQLARLPNARREYADALAIKERHLTNSNDPRAARLMDLADERGRLIGETKEIAEALAAADDAGRALHATQERLGSASSWSTYDTFFGGGALSSAVKHSRLDEAAAAASAADQALAVLRTELTDVAGVEVSAPRLAVDGMTKFMDIWFDNIFTDLAVRDRINQAQRNVAGCLQVVATVRGRLDARDEAARRRLEEIASERQHLLVS